MPNGPEMPGAVCRIRADRLTAPYRAATASRLGRARASHIDSCGRLWANTVPSPSPVRSQPVVYRSHPAQYRDTVAFEIPKCAIV